MKKILFLGAVTVALVGCNRSGTGGYGESETGASSDTTVTTPADTTTIPAEPAPSQIDTNTVETPAAGAPAATDQGESIQAPPEPPAQSSPGQNQDAQAGAQSETPAQIPDQQQTPQ